jgi:Ala-tRNA(Pro) deacylase
MLIKKTLLEKLNSFTNNYTLYEHEAYFTVRDSSVKRGKIKGAHTKNLFLKNKKNHFFLFSCLEKTEINLKKLSKSLTLGNISFANEVHLNKLLGVSPGSVTPFALLNDLENAVNFYLDKNIIKYDSVNFHPLINTSTVNLSTNDLINFLIENKKKVNIYDFDNYSHIR